MPLQATSGAASYDAFGGGVAAVPAYIEEVFSTFLYKGDGVSNADFVINNGIDLQNEGGLVWIKRRDVTENYALTHTGQSLNSNGFYPYLQQGAGAITANDAYGINAFTTTGLTLRGRSGPTANEFNSVGSSMASWTFRKQPKFFDVVTWTGDGNATQTISHNLGSVPGCIIAKVTSTTGNWFVYHRATSGTPLQDYLRLNLTNAANASGSDLWGATSTTITVDSGLNLTTNGATYVAYLFAHDAGGFGLTGTDNVISCGSFTTDSGGSASITLGYEPQWMLVKAASTTSNWEIYDNMRGWSVGGDDVGLFANTNVAENPNIDAGRLTATGVLNFTGLTGALNATYIYIAIRRGPMKVPTSGTSVFEPAAYSGDNTTARTITAGSMSYVDAAINNGRDFATNHTFEDRLRGVVYLNTNLTGAEAASRVYFDTQNGIRQGDGTNGWYNASGSTYVNYNFKRAPSFFDEVCYTGTGANTTFAHNLGVAPELMIAKQRGAAGTGWIVYHKDVGATKYLNLNTTAASATLTTVWNSTAPTSSVFSVGTNTSGNASGGTYVNYLFATCAGVSKVGSYTGTGATQIIDCGFTGGARFVLIKCTNAVGDWYVWDSARGMVFGTDPYLRLNSTAAEFSNLPTGTYTQVTSETGGFGLSAAEGNVNINSYSYIFLAIA